MSSTVFLVVVLALMFRADISALVRAIIARWLKP